jgi:insertion element IS1 protein InsB
MCYEEITCPRCSSSNIVKNGTTANHKQRYRCKACCRQFITDYTYRGCQPAVRQLVLPMTMNASGIRDISRVLRISPNTVLSLIKIAASAVAEPGVPKQIKNLEIDEFWSFVGKKADQRWTWYGFDRERKQVVASVNGRRTDANCRALYEKVKPAKVGTFHTDRWAAYPKILPEKKHQIGKVGTLNIERRNLTFRTRIKRLQRRTICFSKSAMMHDAVLKLHIHHLNPLHHQI